MAAAAPTPKAPIVATAADPRPPSLSDQLKPLSLTLLTNTPAPPPTQLQTKPKSTWVNPSRPRHSVLTLQRHRRSTPTHNPELKELRNFSRNLNDAHHSDQAFFAALDGLDPPPTAENALLILNSLKSWQKAKLFFGWIKTQNFFEVDTIFYNVFMKSLRQGKQFQLVEKLAGEMADEGVPFDNVTYSTIITCASRCEMYDKAVEWFERMYKTGLMPDEVTYSAALDVYAKIGMVEEVMSLYDRARASGWTPDHVAFSVLCKMFGEAGDYDGIQFVLREMRAVGVKPNLVVYNSLIEALGKAGRAGLARSLFDEMVESGVRPNAKTLTALVKIYGKARWIKDALGLWEKMKVNNWPVDFILFNTLLSMCADLGLEEEAEKLFAEMKVSESCRPDSWSYSAMMNVYGSGGKVEKALEVFEELLESGVRLNVMSVTSLIQCLGRDGRIDEVVRVLGVARGRGVELDDRLCGCLLSVIAYYKDESEIEKILDSLLVANPKLANFVRLIGKKETSFEVVQDEFKSILNESAVDVRRPFCNCLIDICRKRRFQGRAQELLYLGTVFGLYPGLHTKNSTEWSLNLRSLSVGAAFAAFDEWSRSLQKAVDKKEELPELFAVYTGAGTHKFSLGLGNALAEHLKEMSAPFQLSEERVGCFVANQEELVSWLQSTDFSALLLAM